MHIYITPKITHKPKMLIRIVGRMQGMLLVLKIVRVLYIYVAKNLDVCIYPSQIE